MDKPLYPCYNVLTNSTAFATRQKEDRPCTAF